MNPCKSASIFPDLIETGKIPSSKEKDEKKRPGKVTVVTRRSTNRTDLIIYRKTMTNVMNVNDSKMGHAVIDCISKVNIGNLMKDFIALTDATFSELDEKPFDFTYKCVQNPKTLLIDLIGKLKYDKHKFTRTHLISCIANALNKTYGCVRQEKDYLITIFHSKNEPTISISDYLYRIAYYSHCSSESMILAIVYLLRLQAKYEGNIITRASIHRFLLTSILCSVKYFDDLIFNNKYFAEIGGIPTEELNKLEIDFLKAQAYDLYVSTDDYMIVLAVCIFCGLIV